ncbi:MAG: PDZ domain-containing protein [Desulfobulbaceae bacterium]|nr:PDZ domain-containing protein [Desulfobulbaceae bacterium]HIJ90553.1 PDZ domain-containing protein [Deltaproteobacteria bacterium]
MKRLNLLANPLFLLPLIGAFIYVYFFYFTDGPVRRKDALEAEAEMGWQVAPQNNPKAAQQAAPGVIMQEPEQLNMGNAQGQTNAMNGEPFFDNQNRQHQMELQAENMLPPRSQRMRLSRQAGDPIAMANQNVQPLDFQPPATLANPVVPVVGAAMGKTWIEAHWIGLEAGPLLPAVAKANNIPPDVSGVMIDEVTLLSADSGLLAGDVITAVNGNRVSDLKSFQNATKLVAQGNQAKLTIYRRGATKNIMVTGPDELGWAQVEGAPMILATDRAPHGSYGPCDKCHVIAPGKTNTGQMAKDLGDILAKTAPNIKKGTPPPHGNRGACTQCHVLL